MFYASLLLCRNVSRTVLSHVVRVIQNEDPGAPFCESLYLPAHHSSCGKVVSWKIPYGIFIPHTGRVES